MPKNTLPDEDLPFDVVAAANRLAAMDDDSLVDVKADQHAKNDLSSLENEANLPSSVTARFMQIIGVIAIVASLSAAEKSAVLAIAGAISGGFILAAGFMQQFVFDVRTLMLRAAAKNSTGKPNA